MAKKRKRSAKDDGDGHGDASAYAEHEQWRSKAITKLSKMPKELTKCQCSRDRVGPVYAHGFTTLCFSLESRSDQLTFLCLVTQTGTPVMLCSANSIQESSWTQNPGTASRPKRSLPASQNGAAAMSFWTLFAEWAETRSSSQQSAKGVSSHDRHTPPAQILFLFLPLGLTHSLSLSTFSDRDRHRPRETQDGGAQRANLRRCGSNHFCARRFLRLCSRTCQASSGAGTGKRRRGLERLERRTRICD